MSEIIDFIKNSIQKNTGIWVEKTNENILESAISPLDLLYVIIDIEEKYGISAKDIITNITPYSFTIGEIFKVVSLKTGN